MFIKAVEYLLVVATLDTVSIIGLIRGEAGYSIVETSLSVSTGESSPIGILYITGIHGFKICRDNFWPNYNVW